VENITCKACQAVVDKKLEFCSSCGEWLGLKIEDIQSKPDKEQDRFNKRTRVPQIKCSNCGNNNLPSVRNCRDCGVPLVKPLTSYGASELPNRKEVPGIRAVFFLALIIPLIAGASYFYNTRIAEEVIEEIEIVEQTTIPTTSTTVQSMLKLQKPLSCAASTTYESGNSGDFSCENLYDNDYTMWQDNSLQCKDGWLEFTFEDEIFIEFIVVQNAEKSTSFKRNYKIRDLLITANDPELEIEKELENDNFEQWVDVNTTTSYLRLDFLSAYPGEDLNGQNAFEECAIQEIRFFGKG
jgi:ribosomal protein L32